MSNLGEETECGPSASARPVWVLHNSKGGVYVSFGGWFQTHGWVPSWEVII